jgi:acetyl esterase/lipase
MRIRRKWLRDLSSIVFSVFYLFAAEQADEKVRKVRGTLTVDHLRVSWNKSTTPYLSFFTALLRPQLARYPPRMIRIPRPPESSYREPIIAWLYYDGPFSTISNHDKVILDIPGGGFVAMNPRTNDDKLLAWAGRTGLPIISLDYRKAPEYPYPYALNECYDVYHTLITSRGRCIGLSGEVRPRIILTGDSAGGNLATGVVLMILQSQQDSSRKWPDQETLPVPEGLILAYPGLDMNIGNWMTDEQMSLIQDRRTRTTNRPVLRRKSEDYYKLTPSTPYPSDEDEHNPFSPRSSATSSPDRKKSLEEDPISPISSSADLPSASRSPALSFSKSPSSPPIKQSSTSSIAHHTATIASSKPRLLRTRLAMSSMISYFNDRILTPEMMRAMIILYIGPHNRPDFSTDFLLSPVLAPEALLARFPKTYFLTGERDPLVDDTVIMAGRIRQAKYNAFIQRKELGLLGSKEVFDEKEHVEVVLLPGISHGFMQFVSIFPEGWKHIFRCARWMEDIFMAGDRANEKGRNGGKGRHHFRTQSASSGDEDRPLEMSRIKLSPKIGARDGGDSAGDGDSHTGSRRGRGRGKTDRRRRSLVSLASEDDLLGRRMKGLAGGLMGMTPDDGGETP